MPVNRRTRKCRRCGHPWNKHNNGPNYGCTVRKYGPGTSGPVFCNCPRFQERGQ